MSKKIVKLIIEDHSNHCVFKNANGGNYLEGITFFLIDDNKFKAVHWSSSDFPYCEHGLGYQDCDKCMFYIETEGGYDCTYRPEFVTLKDIENLIKTKMDYERIEIHYSDGTIELLKETKTYCDNCPQKEYC